MATNGARAFLQRDEKAYGTVCLFSAVETRTRVYAANGSNFGTRPARLQTHRNRCHTTSA
ncbi:hypothetical protein B5M45_30380 [Mycobacterium simiae]|uniref:Uncharacterized protein n=1 Tax=Mycobacterium simiae TaxID=1784 RepID=A0A1X0XIN6_MYCSI|nr:hypothetical protein B5M45_30380 [Mycobacterium simiae]